MGTYLNPSNIELYNDINYSKIYIDKTEIIRFINDILLGQQRYICISRPRRFGKSMTVNMLKAYYSKGCDSAPLFDKLKISGDPEYKKHLNKYNVISLNMTDYIDDANSIEDILGFIEEDVSEELMNEYGDLNYPKRINFIKRLNDRDMLAKKLDIIPLEIVVRNVISGSMAKRLNLKEGEVINNTIYELCLKNDKLGDPLLNRHHAVALHLATYEDLDKMMEETIKINQALKKLFDSVNITLVDFKIEFGKDKDGNIILADEISPDSCRLWDKTTKEILDKDRFRRDLGDVIQAYQQVLERLKNRK